MVAVFVHNEVVVQNVSVLNDFKIFKHIEVICIDISLYGLGYRVICFYYAHRFDDDALAYHLVQLNACNSCVLRINLRLSLVISIFLVLISLYHGPSVSNKVK